MISLKPVTFGKPKPKPEAPTKATRQKKESLK